MPKEGYEMKYNWRSRVDESNSEVKVKYLKISKTWLQS